jgi:hypothetical protein
MSMPHEPRRSCRNEYLLCVKASAKSAENRPQAALPALNRIEASREVA